MLTKTGEIRCTCGSASVFEIGSDGTRSRIKCQQCGREWWIGSDSPEQKDRNDLIPEQ